MHRLKPFYRFLWRGRRWFSGRKIGRWFMVSVVLLGLVALISPFLLRAGVARYYHSAIYRVDEVPAKPVAIIFGAQVTRRGYPSAMLADRVKTGVELYHTGKVDYLLMTGDHLTPEYNEPDAMRDYAIERGVPPEAIWVDYGGLRTYDSCYRAQALFDIHAAILVTQEFHVQRALFICDALGIEAVAVGADYQRPEGYAQKDTFWQFWRETAAMSFALWDILRGVSPRLGTGMPDHLGESLR